MHNFYKWIGIILGGAIIFPCLNAHAATLPEDETKAVILAYHRIGEDAYPDTNLRTEQFIEHVKELEGGDYTILPLSDIITALTNATPLPKHTIAITFEGGHKSAQKNAFPLLLERKIPFTVFYASEKADQNNSEYLNWKELTKLRHNSGVTLATLPALYDHMTGKSREEMLALLNKARQNHREHFGEESAYLAYPFGEYSLELKTIAETQGFKAALTLNSGVAYSGSDLYALPRFSMTEDYADLNRFRMITKARPLPVSEISPENPLLGNEPPTIGFTLPDGLSDKTPNCFLSGYGKLDIQQLGARIEIRPQISEQDTRLRMNCTITELPEKDKTPEWRWFGMLYHKNTTPIPVKDAPPPPPE